MYKHVNSFKIYTVCVYYLHIHNKYTQYTYINNVNKDFYFGCD